MESTENALRFSLVLGNRPVVLTDEQGNPHDYELREMDGTVRDAYMNRMKKNLILNEDGDIIGFKSFDGMHSGLLSLCMFDSKGKVVTEDELQKFPGRVLAKLFEAAQKMNGLEPTVNIHRCPKCNHEFTPGKKTNTKKVDSKND